MGRLQQSLFILAALACSPLAAQAAVPESADPWPEIPQEQLKLAKPTIQEDADAEILLWDTQINHAVNSSGVWATHSNHVRIKVFTEQGIKDNATVEIVYDEDDRIRWISARTVHPDGSSNALRESDIYEQTLVRVDEGAVKVKKFTFPGVEPGDIVEYRWQDTERRGDYLVEYIALQKRLPIHRLEVRIKPATYPGAPPLWWQGFNVENPRRQVNSRGYLETSYENLPALHKEPYMPPVGEVSPWLFVYYANGGKLESEEIWSDYARSISKEFDGKLRVSDEVRQKAIELTTGIGNTEDRLSRLHDFCRGEIENTDRTDDSNGESHDPTLAPESPTKVLKKRRGSGQDVMGLFAAMARALGYRARYALVASREGFLFTPEIALPGLFTYSAIAVISDGRWQFYDPATPYLPAGILPWQQEGVSALICDRSNPVFVTTPQCPTTKNHQYAVGELRLDRDGTLTGHVQLELRGQPAVSWWRARDANGREWDQHVKDWVDSRSPSAEILDIKPESKTGVPEVVKCGFELRIPDYAVVTAKRIFLQPLVFCEDRVPSLAEADRRYPVMLPYAWVESDSITVSVPEGFEIVSSDSTISIPLGSYGRFRCRFSAGPTGNSVVATRHFRLDRTAFEAVQYGAVRAVFDQIGDADRTSVAFEVAGDQRQ